MSMKLLLSALIVFAVLAPSLAHAGKYSNGGVKRTTCSSYTYITGTTVTRCRTAR
jgi:hypothetical protein